jgi:hypothetical protein
MHFPSALLAMKYWALSARMLSKNVVGVNLETILETLALEIKELPLLPVPLNPSLLIKGVVGFFANYDAVDQLDPEKLAALVDFLVMPRSWGEGVGSPEGWLWTRMRELQEDRRADLKISFGCTTT